MEDNIDFGELSHDEDLKTRILGFKENFKEVQKLLQTFRSIQIYDDLSPEDKVSYELFHAFAINSLYWFYLRMKGIDPNQHDIKSELNRIKEYMTRSKKIYEKNTLMPRLDQGAAKRFVKGGLWTPKSNANKQNIIEEVQISRKRKRDFDESEPET